MQMRVLMCLLVVGLMAAIAFADPTTDTFYGSFTENNEMIDGGGSGYAGGEWYYYENTDWWNQWFYDDPPSWERWKKINYNVNITVEQPAVVDVVINWSTMDYPENPGEPPIPPLDPTMEDLYIHRELVWSGEVETTKALCDEIIIPDYNPEWVSIDIRVDGGMGADVDGTICHECIPEPMTLSLLGFGGFALLRRRRQ